MSDLDARAERFLRRAHDRIRQVTLDDLLSFLTVRDIAPGSMYAGFAEAFAGSTSGERRRALIEAIRRGATADSDIAQAVEVELLRLTNDLWGRPRGAGDRLRRIVEEEFDVYATDNAEEIVRTLIIASARADERDRKLLVKRYRTTDARYAQRYEALVGALGRRLIPDLKSFDEFALIMASLLDGFLARRAIEQDDRVRQLFSLTVVPLISALTYPVGAPPPDDEQWLYHGLRPSATASHLRTPPGSEAIGDSASLRGVWRGTMWPAGVVTRERVPSGGKRETYLVVAGGAGQLQITNFIETGLSRMILPQVTIVDGRHRLACLYEAELVDNPTPDTPSHRGAWVLESDEAVSRLAASYFNDRGAYGTFVFDGHVPRCTAETFLDARSVCAAELGTPWQPASHAETPGT
jgi:hypothetical protein